jgi:hypothetical protein
MGRVISHPGEQEAVGVIAEVIESLRSAREWGDFYEMQRRIVGRPRQKGERFAKASRGRGDRVSYAEHNRRIQWVADRLFEGRSRSST